MAEWSKAADCKSVSYSRIGSNPILFIFIIIVFFKIKRDLRFIKLERYFLAHNRNIGTANVDSNCASLKFLLITYKSFNSLLACLLKLNLYSSTLSSTTSVNKSLSSFNLDLNFLRNRFFPQLLSTVKKSTIFNCSLGVTSSYFSKKKSFLRSKAAYALLSVYIRRLLVYTGVNSLMLRVIGLPLHLNFITRLILLNSNVLYRNPFKTKFIVNEKDNPISIKFSYVIFINNKFFGLQKRKKKGRLKRKINKRISVINNITD